MDNPVMDNGKADNSRATNVAGTATEVLGFVERAINYVNLNFASAGTLIVSEGDAFTVAVCGDYWAISSTDATVGQAVLASKTNGSISTGTASDTAIDTGWKVKTAGKAGEPIIISNWKSKA